MSLLWNSINTLRNSPRFGLEARVFWSRNSNSLSTYTSQRTQAILRVKNNTGRIGRAHFSNSRSLKDKELDLTNYPPENIRNFSIIAHIDHGKSTLADRLLETTGTITTKSGNKQVLDKLKVERERGITVKAQTVSMFYKHKGKEYLVNLIDTPGHVDFSYEVSRSLAACQGAILLVDACQGIQAQTVANFFLAFGQDLSIIPVINKVDLPTADPDKVESQIANTFELDTNDIIKISAKSGLNIDQVLPAVIEKIQSPVGDMNGPLRALLFDSWYDAYVGVICLMAIKEGRVQKGDKVLSVHSGNKYDVMEVGIIHPERTPTKALHAGQVGYIVINMKVATEAHIGDTFCHQKQSVEPLPGFVPVKSMVFAGVYPVDTNDFTKLEESITKLTLNDSSVTTQRETSVALGQGWRLGFLGTLHLDVFRQRLEEEYAANVIVTQPTVPYRVEYTNGEIKDIRTPAEFPEPEDMAHKVIALREPMVMATMIFPDEYMGPMMELCGAHRGEQQEYSYIDDTRVLMKYTLPMSEVVTDFFDQLKSRTSGYASFDYEETEYQESDLVKLNVLLNGSPVDALAMVLHRSKAELVGREWAKKLKSVIERQLFEVVIQTAIGKKIIARESISAMRKNVTAKCYGGDVSRKMKLLNKQKEGKKRMKMIGNVELPQDAFYTLLKK
ncbi:Translation factor guf1 mitochondrial [Basidiobolus ranarum]|uniref:Translation factor guf1 mitochondrial n=1 Tax=Basidiobolus ranarum TaxID=34480 RepID=A0ABR2X4H3_9FUNG